MYSSGPLQRQTAVIGLIPDRITMPSLWVLKEKKQLKAVTVFKSLSDDLVCFFRRFWF